MINSKLSHGMVPSDILIRTAIIAALDDLRKNPFLLDYCFAWYSNDDLTSKIYGDVEKQRAKKWFLSHEIFVSMNYRADDVKFPLIAIGLQSSIEDLSTLGDTNFDTEEEVKSSEVTVNPNLLLGPFTPKSYDSITGIVILPDNLTTDNIFVNNILFDKTTNIGYVIRDIIDIGKFKIDPGISANFINAFIAPIDDFYITSLESCSFKQTYSIKCFAQSEPVHAIYLHTIVEFILLRYKELLLEGRGFDRSTISSGPLYNYQETGVELTFARDITLQGFVRQYWPKLISPKIQGIKINGISIIGAPATPEALLKEVEAQGWWSEADDLPSVGGT